MYNQGPTIVLAVDDKGTYGGRSLTANEACGKFYDTLPTAPLGIAVSGNLSTCESVVAEFSTQLKTFRKQQENDGDVLYCDHVRVAIREARQYEYGMFFEEELRGLLGMSRSEWLVETNPEKKRKGWKVARAARLNFPVWLIVGGFLRRDFVLMRSSGACVTQVGVGPFAAGIGWQPALNQLHTRKQDNYHSVPRTLLHVAEAMDQARLAFPNSIGRPADYLVLRPEEPMMRFSRDSPVLKAWLAQFARKDSQPMQTDPSFRKEFEEELQEHRSVNR